MGLPAFYDSLGATSCSRNGYSGEDSALYMHRYLRHACGDAPAERQHRALQRSGEKPFYAYIPNDVAPAFPEVMRRRAS